MYSSNIELDSELQEPLDLVMHEALDQTHQSLKINKGVIYYFMSDEELLEVNKQSLNHDYYTDIITFDYSDDEDIEQHEILISWDRVKDNSKTLGTDISEELHRVCIHGLLHISGQNDDTDEAKQKMRTLENHYLALYCST
jgi:rRNA maturation RNase YbeY